MDREVNDGLIMLFGKKLPNVPNKLAITVYS